MSGERREGSSSTKVTVMGQEYVISGEVEPSDLIELADYVDSRMRELQNKASGISAAKIAVLAAMNISDELFALRRRLAQAEEFAETKVEALMAEVGAHLESESDSPQQIAEVGGE